MSAITDALTHLIDAPLPNILVLGGLLFLVIAVLGRINSPITINPGTAGRVIAFLLGLVLIPLGLWWHMQTDQAKPTRAFHSLGIRAYFQQLNPPERGRKL